MRTEDYVSAGGTQKLATASSSKLITKLTRKALGNKAAKSQQQQQQQQQYLTPVSSCSTSSSSGSGNSMKPLRKYSSNGVLSVVSSGDKSSTKLADNGSISTLTSNNSNSSHSSNKSTPNTRVTVTVITASHRVHILKNRTRNLTTDLTRPIRSWTTVSEGIIADNIFDIDGQRKLCRQFDNSKELFEIRPL